MHLLNTFRLIAGLLSLCLFLTINMFLRNWYFCGQTCFKAPFFMRFSTSNETVAFSWFEKFISFGSLFCFGLQKHGIRCPCLSGKYSDLLSVFPSCPESAQPPLTVVKFESLYGCCTLFWNWNHRLFLWSQSSFSPLPLAMKLTLLEAFWRACALNISVIYPRKSLPNNSFPKFYNNVFWSAVIDFAWLEFSMEPAPVCWAAYDITWYY